jgi:hypothetical protein
MQEHERWLAETHLNNTPVVVTHYPKVPRLLPSVSLTRLQNIKAFYMKESAGDSRTVDAFDLLVCEGVWPPPCPHMEFRCLALESLLVVARVRTAMTSYCNAWQRISWSRSPIAGTWIFASKLKLRSLHCMAEKLAR